MNKTKQRNRLSRALVSRLLLAVLLLGTLGLVLTSCGSGGSTKATTLTYTMPDMVDGWDADGMTQTFIEDIAKKQILDNNKKNALIIREKLVAALNGYDITGDPASSGSNYTKYQTEPLPEADPSKSVEYAEKVFAEYKIVPAGGKLNNASLQMLVNSFKTTVDVDAKLGVIDQLLNWIGIGFGWLINVPGFGSFILGTLYFAILLEILMLPLGIRQQNNSRKQAKLRPREMAIRNKYKGRTDQVTMQKLNEEIRTLYEKEGYSPMAGCLPLLLTMPFLIFLYYIVLDPMVYMMGVSEETAGAFLTYASAHPAAGGLGLSLGSARGTIEVLSYIRESNLSIAGLADFSFFTNSQACFDAVNEAIVDIPNFSLFGINMGETPKPFAGNWWLMLIPVLTFVVYWGSGKITRKFTFQPMQNEGDPSQGCSNTMMNVMMPAMSAFFTFMVPAAIGIYWMFKSIVATLKQIILYKLMPMPTFTEEDYKAAERELAGKEKNKPVKKSGTRNPNVRSLHHIDDEDYEDTPSPTPKKGATKPDYVEPEEEEKPHVADNSYAEGVSLKDEGDRPTRDGHADKADKAADTDNTDNTDNTDKKKRFGKKKDK